MARDIRSLVFFTNRPHIDPLIQTLKYFQIWFWIHEDSKITCISVRESANAASFTVRDSANAASLLLEIALTCHQRSRRQRKDGISTVGDGAQLDLRRQSEGGFSTVSNSVDTNLALSPTSLMQH